MVPRARERAAICSFVKVGVFPEAEVVEAGTGGAEVGAEVDTDAETVDLRIYGGYGIKCKMSDLSCYGLDEETYGEAEVSG